MKEMHEEKADTRIRILLNHVMTSLSYELQAIGNAQPPLHGQTEFSNFGEQEYPWIF